VVFYPVIGRIYDSRILIFHVEVFKNMMVPSN
jgi:hypothetical protein